LDTVACDSNDFYLFENPTDPQGQLAWLRTELYESEANEQPVFIIGHIPPGNFGCDSEWSARYRAIIDRFTNIIRGQFFGHTHEDHFEVARSYIDNSPMSSVFITPSLTTRSYLHPSFRIYEVDTDTNVLVNYYQYHLDLDKWNKNTTGPLQWDLFYDFLSQWNVSDLSPSTLDKLADSFLEDPALMSEYLWVKNTGNGPKPKIDTDQAWHLYCEAKNAVYSEVVDCLGDYANSGDYKTLRDDAAVGEWYDYDKASISQ